MMMKMRKRRRKELSYDTMTHVPGENAQENCPSQKHLDLISYVRVLLQLITGEDTDFRARQNEARISALTHASPVVLGKSLDFATS